MQYMSSECFYCHIVSNKNISVYVSDHMSKECNLLYTCKKVFRYIARICEHPVILLYLANKSSCHNFMKIARRQAFFSAEQRGFVIHWSRSMVRVIAFWGWFSDLQYSQFDSQGPKSYIYDKRTTHINPNIW